MRTLVVVSVYMIAQASDGAEAVWERQGETTGILPSQPALLLVVSSAFQSQLVLKQLTGLQGYVLICAHGTQVSHVQGRRRKGLTPKKEEPDQSFTEQLSTDAGEGRRTSLQVAFA